jgi:hypothetical protein
MHTERNLVCSCSDQNACRSLRGACMSRQGWEVAGDLLTQNILSFLYVPSLHYIQQLHLSVKLHGEAATVY